VVPPLTYLSRAKAYGSVSKYIYSTAVTASKRSLQKGDTSVWAGRGRRLSFFTAIHDPPAQLEEEGPTCPRRLSLRPA
jgi:hypothetical protein